MAIVNKEYLDYPGLTRYDELNKDYIDTADGLLDTRLQAVESTVQQGIDIHVDSSGTRLLIGYVYDERGMLVDFTFANSSLLIG